MRNALILLDVDGVLNCLNNPALIRRQTGGGMTVAACADMPRLVVQLTTLGRVEWLSCWSERQTGDLERFFALPHLPTVPRRYRVADADRETDWKLVAAARRVTPGSPRPVVWIEDGFAPETREWAAARGRVLLIDVTAGGLGWAHVETAHRWLEDAPWRPGRPRKAPEGASDAK
jgi:hypothetical protein